MKQGMYNAQLKSGSSDKTNDFKSKKSLGNAPEPQVTTEAYKAILARELLINEIPDSHAKYF
jgi:hypothetical protein